MVEEIIFYKRQQWLNFDYGVYKNAYNKELCLDLLKIHLDNIVKYSYYALKPATKIDKIEYKPISNLRKYYFSRGLFGGKQNLPYNPFYRYSKKLSKVVLEK